MIDSVGNVGSVLLLGGSSEIGMAVLTRLTGPRLSRVVMAGRPSATLDQAAVLVHDAGVARVETRQFDATDSTGHQALIDSVFDDGDIDVVVMAFGSYSAVEQPDLDPAAAVRSIDTNLTGAVSVGMHVARRLRKQGHGVVVVFAAAAPAAHPNRTDFVFAAAHAGLDAFATGLSDWLRGSGARLVLVRLGNVPTKFGAKPSSAAPTAQPFDIANAVVAAIRSRRRDLVYVPSSLRAAMSGVRHLPRPLRRRLAP